MTFFLFDLLISSVVGTIIWLLIVIISAFSRKVLSQNVLYYTRLLPIVLLLGGTKLLAIIFSPVYVRMRDTQQVVPKMAVTISDVIEKTSTANISMDLLAPYLLLIWAIGFFSFLLIKLRCFYKFKKRLLSSCTLYTVDDIKIKIVKSDFVSSPLLIGVVNPIIALPQTHISTMELEIILAHELIHMRRRDIYVKLVSMLSNAVHWFNPFVYCANRNIINYCETSCDEILTMGMSKEKRLFYVETILSMLEISIYRRMEITAELCTAKKFMKKRIAYIMNNKDKSSKLTLSVLVFALSLLSTVCAYALNSNTILEQTNDAETVGADPAIMDGSVPIVYPENYVEPVFDWMDEKDK